MNDLDQVVGYHSTTARQPQAPGANPRGFLLDRGRFTIVDVPGAAVTAVLNINDLGQIVGGYQNPDSPPSAMPAPLAAR